MDRRIAAVILLASGFAVALAFQFGAHRATRESQATPPPVSSGAVPLTREAESGGNGISAQCRVESAPFEGHAPLRSVRRALLEKRPARIVSFGTSSTLAADTLSPMFASYPSELERDLEASGLEVEMIARMQAGAVADDAAERLKAEVARLRPDLLVWQVGTNDAVARMDAEEFADRLRETLSWLAVHKIDVVLIDPQYVARLSDDEDYTGIVDQVAAVANESRVLRVNRFDAMADLARAHPSWSHLTADRFRLTDIGYRCAAEYTADAIVAGIHAADRAESGQTP